MSEARDQETRPDGWDGTPGIPGDKGRLAAAAVLLCIPVVALLAVPMYARDSPELFGFPFFFWYQFLWVFLCSAMTYGAYRMVHAARRGSTDPRLPHGRGDGGRS